MTQQSIVYVAWTAYPGALDVVAGLLEAQNPLVLVGQEFFFFGESKVGTPEDLVDWYAERGAGGRLVVCHCVSNRPTVPATYARAFSRNPGDVMAYWARTHRRASEAGSFSRLQWGLGYRDPWRDSAVAGIYNPGIAVRAWDDVLSAVYFRG